MNRSYAGVLAIGTFIVVLFVVVVGAGLFWANAWLLMWAWNILAAQFHLPLVKWIHAAAALLILGSIRGVFHLASKKESS